MQTYEVRSLIDDSKSLRIVSVEQPIVDVFKIWQLKFIERTGREPNLLDVFYAGYVLSNPNVRDQCRIIKEKEIQYKK